MIEARKYLFSQVKGKTSKLLYLPMAGGVTKFMNDYKSMTLNELRRYVLKNREDREAWDEYVSRPRPNATIIPSDIPLEEQQRIFEDLLRQTK